MKFLRELAKQVGAMSEENFELVTSGSFEILAKPPKVGTKNSEAKTTDNDPRHVDAEKIVDDLRKCGARDAAERLLESAASTKADLKAIAKVLDLPVRKSDQVALIRDRIVDSTVGFRLTSAAIRGTKEPERKDSEDG